MALPPRRSSVLEKGPKGMEAIMAAAAATVKTEA
jgi:hypothetical protein